MPLTAQSQRPQPAFDQPEALLESFDLRSPGPQISDLLYNLQDVLITEHVIFAYSLRPVLARHAPNQCVLEVLHDQLVNLVAEILHSALGARHHNRIVERSGSLPLGLVYTLQVHPRRLSGARVRVLQRCYSVPSTKYARIMRLQLACHSCKHEVTTAVHAATMCISRWTGSNTPAIAACTACTRVPP